MADSIVYGCDLSEVFVYFKLFKVVFVFLGQWHCNVDLVVVPGRIGGVGVWGPV